MRPEILYLTDIVEAAGAIARFLSGVEREAFLNDELRQSAVQQKLTVIGEAAARLTAEFHGRHPQVQWRKAVSLRNIAVHEYFSLSWETIWATATQDIPLVRDQVAEILRQIESGESPSGSQKPT
jgi:uncharacterized protein with HEPN domain